MTMQWHLHGNFVTPHPRIRALRAQRRQLFFKPVGGYGDKAVYRGDKLTRRVWDEILAGEFIAQALVPTGWRMVIVNGVQTDLKFDIRAYTCAGQVQLLAARTYRGQTTNFRTPGGGFSPVVVVPQIDELSMLFAGQDNNQHQHGPWRQVGQKTRQRPDQGRGASLCDTSKPSAT
jgi:hypothetical protein